ncbi:MAG: CRISPR-associated protein Cas4 [Desulfurococcaceae archaeon]
MYDSIGYILPLIYEDDIREFNEKLNELRDPSVIYVSDLVVCTHKWHLRRRYPELTFRFEPQLVIGKIIHKGLAELLKNRNFEIEFSLNREVYVNSRKYVLKGRVDAYNRDENVIVEFKYSKLFREKPLEHHVMQLQLYMNMLDADKGVLVYLTPNAMFEFSYSRLDYNIENHVEELIKDNYRPRWNWECRLCIFRKICSFSVSCSLHSR